MIPPYLTPLRLSLTLSAFLVTFLVITPAQADFLGNFIDKITNTGATADISSTQPSSDISSTEPTQKITPPPTGDKLKNAAHIRILDKRTNRLTDKTLTTTAPTTFDNLTIQVQNCRRHHHQVGHHAAWFTIHDIPDAAADTETTTSDQTPAFATELPPPPRFDGWMMSAFPAVAALEHPRYDVRIIECKR